MSSAVPKQCPNARKPKPAKERVHGTVTGRNARKQATSRHIGPSPATRLNQSGGLEQSGFFS